MRLIDADELMKDRVENDPVRIAVQCAPTAFDKEKAIEQLNEAANWQGVYDGEYHIELNDAIEIVEKGGIE